MTVNEIVDYWMRVQFLWVYLEAVFVGGDIAKQLPHEARRFQTVDKSWVKVMERARETPSVIACCTVDSSLLEMLPRMLEQLEICQRSLTGYLESKRLLFPRFFFVSDPVLLEILGQASMPESIQQHLQTIFDSIHHLRFVDDGSRIMAAYSEHEEELIVSTWWYSTLKYLILPRVRICFQLNPPLRCEGPVETWLTRLLTTTKYSLLDRIRQAYIHLMDPELELLRFLDDHHCQLGILGIQIIWTHDAGDALSESKDNPKIMAETNRNFQALLEILIARTTQDLNRLERTKFETLITIHLHQKDIFESIVSFNPS